MKPFPIPVVALGPGSQPDEEPLQYIASPGAMAIFQPPTHRRAATAEALAGARALLSGFADQMERAGFGGSNVHISLESHDPEVVEEVNELLGHGEVSALVGATRPIRIQESAFAGIWRVQTVREDGSLESDHIEAGAIPDALRERAGAARRTPVDLAPDGPDVMNGPAILSELVDAATRYKVGADAHVVNLTLLPVTPEDLDFLAARLGAGAITILSRGYGNCRITSTGLPHTWWVQYFNSTDQLILNTIEVVEVPVVALAASEDYQDSIDRLREWIDTL